MSPDSYQSLVVSPEKIGKILSAVHMDDASELGKIFTSLGVSVGQDVFERVQADRNENKSKIGQKGEVYLYKQLVEWLGSDCVEWINQSGEQMKPYDFIVRTKEGHEWFYIDAKTVLSDESKADKYAFYLSRNELSFAKKNIDKYLIARVFNVMSARPTVTFLRLVSSPFGE